MESQQYTVRDEDQQIRFVGRLLGSSSSEEWARSRGNQQWTEMEIYRTTDGKYVVTKIGRSTKPGQVDFHTSHVAETPQGAVACVYGRDRDGVQYLTIVAREALHEACLADPDLRGAYAVRDLTA